MAPLPGDDPAAARASGADAGVLSRLVAEAFADLAPSRWLIPDPAVRRRVFPGYLSVTWNLRFLT